MVTIQSEKPKNKIKERLESGKFPHSHYTQREIDRFNAVDTIHLLVWYDEDSLSYDNKKLLLKCNKSCIVYPEGVYDSSDKIRFSPIDVLTRFYNMSFPQACFAIKSFMDISFHGIREYCERYSCACRANIASDYNLNAILSDNLNNQRISEACAVAYGVLCNRWGIDRGIVSELIYRNFLVVDAEKNLCFLNYKGNNVISITKYLKSQYYIVAETKAVDRNVGFLYADKADYEYDYYKNVYVFEKIMDMLSYLTLVRKGIVPAIEKGSCLISLDGVRTGNLHNLLREHPQIQRIYTCLSNDYTGIAATQKIKFQREVRDMQPLLRDYSIVHGYVPTWSDMLKSVLEQ